MKTPFARSARSGLLQWIHFNAPDAYARVTFPGVTTRLFVGTFSHIVLICPMDTF